VKQLKTIIIDDEPAAIQVIRSLISHYSKDLVVAEEVSNGLDAMMAITQHKPDIIFLDVDMPRMNGIQLMEKFPDHDFEVIFTTGSSSYALKALKLRAADYLLKPIDPADFILAVERARTQLQYKKDLGSATTRKKLQFPTNTDIVFLEETEISHVNGMGSYCQVFTTNKGSFIVSKNIGQVQEKLSARLFFRCHNSHIVQLQCIARFLSKDGFSVEMKDGTLVEVSRRSKDKLLQALSNNT
jgi:two-component system LytT family response regulator